MKVSLLCFAIVVLGIHGIEWSTTKKPGQGAAEVLRADIFGKPAEEDPTREG